MFLPERGQIIEENIWLPREHIPHRSTMCSAKEKVLTYFCYLICWWYPLCGFSAKSPWLYYCLVRLKHNPSLFLQGILNEANPDRATVTTDPSGVGKACKASGSVLVRALLLMVDNPAVSIRKIWMKHNQKTDGSKEVEGRGLEIKGCKEERAKKGCGVIYDSRTR